MRMSAIENAIRDIVREEIRSNADTEDSASMQILAELGRLVTRLDTLTTSVSVLASDVQEIKAQVTGINDRLAHVEGYLAQHGYTPLGD